VISGNGFSYQTPAEVFYVASPSSQATGCPSCCNLHERNRLLKSQNDTLQNEAQELRGAESRHLASISQLQETIQELDSQILSQDPRLGNRCRQAEESLRQEIQRTEQMRLEINLMKHALEKGFNKVGI